MATKVFNPGRPKLGARLRQPSDAALADVRCFKYADFDYVYQCCENDYVREVLDQIPIIGEHERVLIDVKVHNLKRGEVACVPGWHLDGSINPHGLPKKPETLTLFVTGLCARTEFVDQPLTMEVDERLDFAVMSRVCAQRIPDDVDVWTIPTCQFATYDDSYFHRGSIAHRNERRLLIRTTETDIIKPQNRIYTPYTHQPFDELSV